MKTRGREQRGQAHHLVSTSVSSCPASLGKPTEATAAMKARNSTQGAGDNFREEDPGGDDGSDQSSSQSPPSQLLRSGRMKRGPGKGNKGTTRMRQLGAVQGQADQVCAPNAACVLSLMSYTHTAVGYTRVPSLFCLLVPPTTLLSDVSRSRNNGYLCV